jgi:hypothetical protein
MSTIKSFASDFCVERSIMTGCKPLRRPHKFEVMGLADVIITVEGLGTNLVGNEMSIFILDHNMTSLIPQIPCVMDAIRLPKVKVVKT